jgi:hypothetical protein
VPRLLAVAVCTALLAGCGDAGRKGAVDTATAWIDAVAEKDTAATCKTMAKVGVDALRRKYTDLSRGAPCAVVVRDYRERIADADLAAIRKGGLEAEGKVKNNEIGVFPKIPRFDLAVILLRRIKGDWKVVSTTIGPGAPAAGPAGTATPESHND